MSNVKHPTAQKKQKASSINPFIKMMEDKKCIAQAVEEGNPLSSLKDIPFVKPL